MSCIRTCANTNKPVVHRDESSMRMKSGKRLEQIQRDLS